MMNRLAALLLLTGLAAGTAQAQRTTPEPAVERRVLEDDGVRIEELRVRGLNQRISVQSKTAGVRGYQIITGDDGRDPSQDRRGAGQRVWQLLSF
ncbi:MAG: hypothetical protein Q8N44_17645 [Rubrivivax sp.]|nr:hypothetical protein [Rubrivivax sp.]